MRQTWKIWVTLALVAALMLSWGLMTNAFAARAAKMTTRLVLTNQTQQDQLSSDVSFLSQPRLSPTFIDQVLAAYHSPAAGLGAQIYALGRQAGINSDLLLAIFGNESSFGTTGEARVSHSVGNLRCLDASYALYHPRCADGYAQFPLGWIDGIGAFYHLLKVGYIEGLVTIPLVGHRCTTLAQVIPVWAPTGDGNNPAGYIQAVLTFLGAWYSGRVRP